MTTPSRILLRALEETDLERTHHWHNDPELYATLTGSFRLVSKAAELEWLRRKIGYSNHDVNLAICVRASGEHIGNIYLNEIDWITRQGALGIFIGDASQRNQGYGREALAQLLAHAFLDLNLNKITLTVIADNDRAIKAYERSGFVVEGRLKDDVFKNGSYHDSLAMRICRDEYTRFRP